MGRGVVDTFAVRAPLRGVGEAALYEIEALKRSGIHKPGSRLWRLSSSIRMLHRESSNRGHSVTLEAEVPELAEKDIRDVSEVETRHWIRGLGSTLLPALTAALRASDQEWRLIRMDVAKDVEGLPERFLRDLKNHPPKRCRTAVYGRKNWVLWKSSRGVDLCAYDRGQKAKRRHQPGPKIGTVTRVEVRFRGRGLTRLLELLPEGEDCWIWGDPEDGDGAGLYGAEIELKSLRETLEDYAGDVLDRRGESGGPNWASRPSLAAHYLALRPEMIPVCQRELPEWSWGQVQKELREVIRGGGGGRSPRPPHEESGTTSSQ